MRQSVVALLAFLYRRQENDYSMSHFRKFISKSVVIVGGGI